jgi:hypothetical protein
VAELTNDDRADLALTAVETYSASLTGTADVRTPGEFTVVASELIGDLMHFTDRHAVPFTSVFEAAGSIYTREAPDNDGPPDRPVASDLPAPGARRPGSSPNTADADPITADQRAERATIAIRSYEARIRSVPVSLHDPGEVHELLGDLLADLQHLASREGFGFEAVLENAHARFAEQAAAENIAFHVGDLVRVRDRTFNDPYGAFDAGQPWCGWVANLYPDHTGERMYAVKLPGEYNATPLIAGELEPAPAFDPVTTPSGRVLLSPEAAEQELIGAAARASTNSRGADRKEVSDLTAALVNWSGGTSNYLREAIAPQAAERAAQLKPQPQPSAAAAIRTEFPRPASEGLRSLADASLLSARPRRPPVPPAAAPRRGTS